MAPPPPFGANSAAARDIASVIHPYTDLEAHQTVGPVVMSRGKGVRVWDETGKEYIEAVAGLARASGIAFTVPTSKFAVPFPYGMTLEMLAAQYLGSRDRWMEIAALNGLRWLCGLRPTRRTRLTHHRAARGQIRTAADLRTEREKRGIHI